MRKITPFVYLLCAALWLAPSVAFAADGDGDGIEDQVDNCPLDANPGQEDGDGDEIGDICDDCPDLGNTEQGDSDGDGVGDGCDGCPANPDKIEPGQCGCGAADTDSDNDGTADCNDACSQDPDKTDPGLCGCGEVDTIDSDEDGEPDCGDACPSDPDKRDPGVCGCGTPDTDSDNDNTPDCFDLCVDDPGKTAPGVCGCGVADSDDDNDGLLLCEDLCPDDADTSNSSFLDSDGVGDVCDNCPLDDNPDQLDSDNDGIGNACDICDEDGGKSEPGQCGCGTPDTDTDFDGTADCNDNCIAVNNPDQEDSDNDGVGNACDNCPGDANGGQNDNDNDGIGNVCDGCPDDASKAAPGQCGCGVAETDSDNDGIADCVDNCPAIANADQADSDIDGTGDVCDPCAQDPSKVEPGQCGCGTPDLDGDNDGTADCNDNCPNTINQGQEDGDNDGYGDACDNCSGVDNSGQEDSDGDNVGDVCDNCPSNVNGDQGDGDGDNVGDVCDNCPAEANPGQEDGDFDGDGDVCDDLLCIPQGPESCDGEDDDCDGEIDNGAECLPGLSCQQGVCQPGRADFAVSTADIVIEDRDVDPGELFTIEAEIHNIGAVDGVNVPVNLLDMGFVVASATIDFLPAGESATVVFEHQVDEASLRVAQVRIDPDDFFDEIDEENNNATKVLRIGQPPAGFNGRLVVEADSLTHCRGGDEPFAIRGNAYYEFEDDGVTFTFPVQGGLVSIAFDGRVYNTHTNIHGRFHRWMEPQNVSGDYPTNIHVSDSDIEGSTDIIVRISDNPCTGSGHVGGPRQEDAWVHSHDIALAPTHRPTLGESIEITSSINYWGDKIRPNIPVETFAYHPEGGELVRESLGTGSVSFNGAPGTVDFTVDWTNDDEGVYIIQTAIDPDFQQYRGNDKATRLIVVGEYQRYPADIVMSPDPFDRLCSDTLTATIQLPPEVDPNTIDFTGGGVYIAEPPELQDNDGDGTQLIRAIADTAEIGDFNGDGTPDARVEFDASAFAAATPEGGLKLIEIVGFLDTRDAFSGTYRIELNTSDVDDDGFGDACDNCPNTFNPSQDDSNGDGEGDDCDSTMAPEPDPMPDAMPTPEPTPEADPDPGTDGDGDGDGEGGVDSDCNNSTVSGPVGTSPLLLMVLLIGLVLGLRRRG